MARDPSYAPPSALEVETFKPETFAVPEVKDWLERFEDGFHDELEELLARILGAWENELARPRGYPSLMRAAEAGAVKVTELNPFVVREKERMLGEMEESGKLFAWEVEDRAEDDQPSVEERRRFVGAIMSRYLERAFLRIRNSAVIALLAWEAPSGVEFYHRAKLRAAA